MTDFRCSQCGAPLEPGMNECRFCGEKFTTTQPPQYVQPAPQQQMPVYYTQQPYMNQAPLPYASQTVSPNYIYPTGINPTWPIKSKTTAGLLAIFLGGIGIHKFYLGKTGMGILYFLFCWTGIPAVIAFIEGLIYLFSNDENFQLKHRVRLKG